MFQKSLTYLVNIELCILKLASVDEIHKVTESISARITEIMMFFLNPFVNLYSLRLITDRTIKIISNMRKKVKSFSEFCVLYTVYINHVLTFSGVGCIIKWY